MKNGFTLVELSIVLVIIGLLIGGILVGQSMIKNVQMKRAVSELIQYQVMIRDFYYKFNGMPGDIDGYKFWGSACGNNYPINGLGTNLACNGNENGAINNWPQTETLLVWRHLYFGGYLDIPYSQAYKSTIPAFVPDDNIVGAELFSEGAIYFPESGGINDFTMRIALPNNHNAGNPSLAAVAGDMMVALEAKYDDGIPNSGIIVGTNGGTSGAIFSDNCLASATTYSFTRDSSRFDDSGCILYIKPLY